MPFERNSSKVGCFVGAPNKVAPKTIPPYQLATWVNLDRLGQSGQATAIQRSAIACVIRGAYVPFVVPESSTTQDK